MTSEKKTILITGNTFPVKEELKALGGRWNPTEKGWYVPADKADEARRLVGAAPAKTTTNASSPRRRFGWRPCGYPGCSPNYCDECDGEGYRNGR